jgi:hypothetical protein
LVRRTLQHSELRAIRNIVSRISAAGLVSLHAIVYQASQFDVHREVGVRCNRFSLFLQEGSGPDRPHPPMVGSRGRLGSTPTIFKCQRESDDSEYLFD